MNRNATIYFKTPKGRYVKYRVLSWHLPQYDAVTCCRGSRQPIIRRASEAMSESARQADLAVSMKSALQKRYAAEILAYNKGAKTHTALAESLIILPVVAWNKLAAIKRLNLVD